MAQASTMDGSDGLDKMDIIVTGATGFVGGEVVRQAIANDLIGRIFILTRNMVPEDIANHPKTMIFRHPNFLQYSPELLEQLAGCEACIWCIGGRTKKFINKLEESVASVFYPMFAASYFMEHITPKRGGPFRFVFVSRRFAEQDEKKFLFFSRHTRSLKGGAEKVLLQVASSSHGRMEALMVRPGRVVAGGGSGFMSKLAKLAGFIPVDKLAQDLVRIAVEEGNHHPIIEMKDLMKRSA